jgi:DNA-directed RNA polymerase specialized sigma24 family protein
MELIPKSSRRVLKLAVIGYKYGEIANMLSLTENTVKWQVHEARKRLNILIGDKI